MNTAAATALDSAPPSAEPRHHRRSREEVEVLAKNFIAAPEGPSTDTRPRTRLALAAGGVALAALLVAVSWPDAGKGAPRPAAEKPRATEADQWRARFEAEQERKRKELRAGSDYLAKMAAAESALVREMGTRASRLTAVVEAPAKPVPARRSPVDAEPTPREAPARAAVASAPPAPTPVQAPAPAPAAVAKAEAPAATVAAAPQCKLHVSQLSSSGTLTYTDVKGMKGARLDGAGNVLMPPVTLDDGRRVTFQVAPDGCMKWRRA